MKLEDLESVEEITAPPVRVRGYRAKTLMLTENMTLTPQFNLNYPKFNKPVTLIAGLINEDYLRDFYGAHVVESMLEQGILEEIPK